MKIFKLSMRFLVCQLVLIVVSVSCVIPFYNMSQNNPYMFSLITGLIYFAVMYSASWRMGRADSRKIPGFFPDMKLPLWVGLTTLIIPVVLYIIRFAFPDIWKLSFPFLDGSVDFFVTGCKVYGTPDMIFRTWYFYFARFIPNSNPVAYFIVMLVLPAIIFAGYRVGLTRFSVTEYLYAKLVFKKDEKNPGKEDKLRK